MGFNANGILRSKSAFPRKNLRYFRGSIFLLLLFSIFCFRWDFLGNIYCTLQTRGTSTIFWWTFFSVFLSHFCPSFSCLSLSLSLSLSRSLSFSLQLTRGYQLIHSLIISLPSLYLSISTYISSSFSLSRKHLQRYILSLSVGLPSIFLTPSSSLVPKSLRLCDKQKCNVDTTKGAPKWGCCSPSKPFMRNGADIFLH